MAVEEDFGRVLRDLRKERGLSQEALAHAAGIARNYVSLLELGQNSASVGVLFALASALKVPASELIRRVEERMSA